MGSEIGEDVLRAVFNEADLSENGRAVFRYLLLERDKGDGKRVTCRDKQIADAIGVNRVTVNRRKAELTRKGFVNIAPQVFDHRTGRYEPTVYDLRPGVKKLQERVGVLHGKPRADTETMADRVTVDTPENLVVLHGDEGGCYTVEGEAAIELEADRVTGAPCSSLLQVPKGTRESEETPAVEGVVPPPDDNMKKMVEAGRAGLRTARVKKEKERASQGGKSILPESEAELIEVAKLLITECGGSTQAARMKFGERWTGQAIGTRGWEQLDVIFDKALDELSIPF